MSVKAMSAVFERYPSGGGEMLLALALADVARDDGVLMLNDSIAELARKTRQTERGVQKQLKRMQEIGWLQCVRQSDGGRNRVSVYRINPDWIAGAELSPVAANDERVEAAEGVSERPGNPERGSGLRPQNPEPRSGFVDPETPNGVTRNPEPRSGAYRTIDTKYITPPIPPSRGAKGAPAANAELFREPVAVALPGKRKRGEKRAPIALQTWLDECRAAGEEPIPRTDPVFGYCSAVGIDDEVLRLHWREFKRRRSRGQRQADWRQAFRNSVEGNWFGLWALMPDGTCILTTKGRQARAYHEALDAGKAAA